MIEEINAFDMNTIVWTIINLLLWSVLLFFVVKYLLKKFKKKKSK